MRLLPLVLGSVLVTLTGATATRGAALEPFNWLVYQTSGISAGAGGAVGTPDGLVWLAARGGLIRMDGNGTYAILSTQSADPSSLAVGADKRVYSTACCAASGTGFVLAMTSGGTMSRYFPPSRDRVNDGVVLGPDGNIWFTEFTHVASLRPDGTITEYKIALPDGLQANQVAGIASSAGRIWFPINNYNVSPYRGYLASVEPRTGIIHQFRVPCFDPQPVVGGPQGDLWAACRSSNSTTVNILRMTPKGHSTVYANPLGITYYGANTMVATPKALWFVTFSGGSNPNSLGAFDEATRKVRDFATPPSLGMLKAVTLLERGRFWVEGGSQSPTAGIFLRP
jgi:streptogramin lyase